MVSSSAQKRREKRNDERTEKNIGKMFKRPRYNVLEALSGSAVSGFVSFVSRARPRAESGKKTKTIKIRNSILVLEAF